SGGDDEGVGIGGLDDARGFAGERDDLVGVTHPVLLQVRFIPYLVGLNAALVACGHLADEGAPVVQVAGLGGKPRLLPTRLEVGTRRGPLRRSPEREKYLSAVFLCETEILVQAIEVPTSFTWLDIGPAR